MAIFLYVPVASKYIYQNTYQKNVKIMINKHQLTTRPTNTFNQVKFM